MQIPQKSDAAIGFVDRFDLSRMVGHGRLKSFAISVKTMLESKEEVTQFFIKELRHFIGVNESVLQNKKLCDWTKDGSDLISRIEARYVAMINKEEKYKPLMEKEGQDSSKLWWSSLFKEKTVNSVFDKNAINTPNYKPEVTESTDAIDRKMDPRLVGYDIALRELDESRIKYHAGIFTIEDKNSEAIILNGHNSPQRTMKGPVLPENDDETKDWARSTYKEAPLIQHIHQFRDRYLKKLGADIK